MKHFIIALIAGIFVALPAMAATNKATPIDRAAEIKRAEQYLNNLHTAKADFIQTSSLGARLSGQFYLDRPGRMRFNYNEIRDFIVADGFFVYYYDDQMKQQSNAPIGQTLADFLLREDLSLHDDLKVTDLQQGKDDQIVITVVQKDEPGAGKVQLFFNPVPYALASWRVTDAQGEVTDVVLKNMETGMKLDNSLFGYKNPNGRKKVND